MTGPIPVRLPGPTLVDSGSVLREQVVKDSGHQGRIFYLRKVNHSSTGFPDFISRSEADNYKRLGLQIVLNYEDLAANWCLQGFDMGRSRGDHAASYMTQVGCEDAMCYLSVDFRPTNADEMARVVDCARGWLSSALGPRARAVYGFANVMRRFRELDLADYFWMCGDIREAFVGDWRNGIRTADLLHVNMWQQNNEFITVDGKQCDINYILREPIGAWGEQEDDMPNEIAQAVLDEEKGPGSTPTTATGWAMHRYHLAADRQPRLSQIAVLGGLDEKLRSELAVMTDPNNPRPRPPQERDDLWGHVMSALALGWVNHRILIEVADKLGINVDDLDHTGLLGD